MQIDSIRLLHVAEPLAVAEPFGEREITRHESVRIELHSGEHSAWGEADPGTAPGESAEWAAGAVLCLKDWLAPALVGQDIASGQALQDRWRHIAGNSAAKAALDIAWWNLESRRQGISLPELLGADKTTLSAGLALDHVPIQDNNSLDELMAKIDHALQRGYESIGLKFRPGHGVEMIRAVRAVYPTMALWIDCDGLCRLDQRETFFRLDDFLLRRVEQPLAADDLVGHAMLQEAIRTPIALDQSISSLDRVEQALDLGSCREVRIDPQRVGGITPALAIAAACSEKGATALAGVARTNLGLSVARALAGTPPFAGIVEVAGSTLSAMPADLIIGQAAGANTADATCGGARGPSASLDELQPEQILVEFVL